MADPFQVTMGRRPDPPEFLRWVPFHKEVHEHQKETALALSATLAVLAGCLLLYRLDRQEATQDADWVRLPWVSSSCKINAVGVAYRGTCRLDTSMRVAPHQSFAECRGPTDAHGGVQDRLAVHEEWLQTDAGRCAASGDRDYRRSAAYRQLSDEDSAEDLAHGAAEAPLRSLIVIPRRSPQRCHNGFVAWAAVHASNQSGGSSASHATCAYRYGSLAASLTGDWAEVDRDLKRLAAAYSVGQELPCQQLSQNSCVIAFGRLADLVASEAQAAPWLTGLCVLLAAASLLLVLMAVRWHWLDNGCCGLHSTSHHRHSPVPTQDPWYEFNGEAGVQSRPLSDRVFNIVKGATAHLREITPASSAGHSRRASGSRRTVEVNTRNIAAEFLRA